ncbi:MAG: HEAT repeat domain-containing protein [Planctomycetota bacterium]|nr:HEAT repeat domain-containing protein [Planctomycetota bacterium]
MKTFQTLALVMTAALLAATSVWAAPATGVVPQAPDSTPQLKDLDTLVPDAAGDDIQKRANAQKAIEVLAMNAARPGAEAERAAASKALAAKLGAATPQLARVWLLRQLQLIGRAEAVPAVAALLDDKDPLIRESARRALQWNPAPEAAATLRAALDKAADPAWRVAMINALAGRNDAASAPAIVKALGDKDESVVAAALAGLGNLGGADAAKALAAARTTVPAKLRAAATDAYLKCGDLLVKEGKKDEAAAIFQAVFVPAEPEATRLAALRGLVAANGEKAIPLVAEVLAGKEESMKAVALSFIQDIPGPGATAAMVGLLAKLSPSSQAALLTQLGVRGDATAKAAVVEATRNADAGVRAAALGALGYLGGAAEVPLLGQAAAGSGPDADAARAALVQMRGPEAAQAMIAAAAKGDPKVRAAVIAALASRKAVEAAPVLATAAADADATVRSEALKALEAVGDEKTLPALIAVLTKAQATEDQQGAERAILAICSRASNKDACLRPVLAALGGAKMPARGTLLRALGRLGGTGAVGPVRAALNDPDAAVKDAAVRALADWPDATVAADLLAIAKTETKQTLQVIALRGYLRLAGLPDCPAAEKVKMCQEALAVAKRPDEKKLILGVLGDVNTAEAFLMTVPMLQEQPVREEAAQASTKIAKALGNKLPPETKAAMETVISFTKNKNARKDAEDILKKVKK